MAYRVIAMLPVGADLTKLPALLDVAVVREVEPNDFRNIAHGPGTPPFYEIIELEEKQPANFYTFKRLADRARELNAKNGGK